MQQSLTSLKRIPWWPLPSSLKNKIGAKGNRTPIITLRLVNPDLASVHLPVVHAARANLRPRRYISQVTSVDPQIEDGVVEHVQRPV